MGPETITLIIIGVFLVLLLTGIPIAFAMMITGLVGYSVFGGGWKALEMASGIPWYKGFSYTILAIPIFVFMGHLMSKSGGVDKFFSAMANWMGRTPGSLGLATLMTCGAFAALCGSGAATQATMATIAWPRLEKYRYQPRLGLGLLLGGGSLGPLIPPSGALIVYGALVEVSVARLFMAALIPGLIVLALMMAYVLVRSALDPSVAPVTPAVSLKKKIAALVDLLPFSAIIAIILGGLYFGWMTPTESASVGVALAVILMIINGRFTFKTMKEAIRESLVTCGFILILIVFAMMVSDVLIYYRLPQLLLSATKNIGMGPAAIFFSLVIFYLIMGMFIEGLSLLVITIPLLAPLLRAAGIDLLWLGPILVVLIEVGTMTPPYAIHVFIIQGITKRPLDEIYAGAMPFIIIWAASILLFYFLPALVTWLPGKM